MSDKFKKLTDRPDGASLDTPILIEESFNLSPIGNSMRPRNTQNNNNSGNSDKKKKD